MLYLFPISAWNFREGELFHIVIWVHRHNLIFSRRAQHPNNFNQLINIACSHERRLENQHLNNNTPNRPHIYLICVLRCAKYKLRSSIAPRTDIGNVGLARHKSFCRTKIAQN